MSYNSNPLPPGQGAPPSGYQIGVGAPANQQYLQQQHTPQEASASYAPPPAPGYTQEASDIPPQTQQQYPPPPAQAAQQYPPPPAQHAPENVGLTSQDQQCYPPPPAQQPQDAPLAGHDHHQYDPTPRNTMMTTASGTYPVPAERHSANFGDDDPANPIHYTRDPHKLVAYLVPFPKPSIRGVDSSSIPDRFLIYTPPPPPLSAPKEGEKEDKLHKVQRKWQEEVRAARTSDAKVTSWKGVKSRATKGISYVMSKTTTSNLDFVNRIPGAKADPDKHADDGVAEGDTTKKTVGLEEMVLVYPSSYTASPDQVKAEFINTMMRTKSKAQRDSVIATGLLPVSGAIDLLATVVWPFGGLLEIDGVWAYSSIRGAKTARSVTKRLASSSYSGNIEDQTEEQELAGDQLRLSFTQSPRLEILQRYLVTKCREYDHKHFPSTEVALSEGEVLAAIGWSPSQTGNAQKNWEDEQWETEEVKADLRSTLGKAAKEWDKWCNALAKNPEKALKK
ncbi:hypothetical protein N7G274_003953 [Stereocaulon virgatum]|uniref:Secreted protein n=1 Tax=Stereocaulon virgatum TaxID=373712 RepID=A0ABR4ADV7_9LECA